MSINFHSPKHLFSHHKLSSSKAVFEWIQTKPSSSETNFEAKLSSSEAESEQKPSLSEAELEQSQIRVKPSSNNLVFYLNGLGIWYTYTVQVKH